MRDCEREKGAEREAGRTQTGGNKWLDAQLQKFPWGNQPDHPLFLITYSYIAHCMEACGAKGEWSLFSLLSLSLSLSLLSYSPL